MIKGYRNLKTINTPIKKNHEQELSIDLNEWPVQFHGISAKKSSWRRKHLKKMLHFPCILMQPWTKKII